MDQWKKMDNEMYQTNHEINKHDYDLYDEFEKSVGRANLFALTGLLFRNR